MSRDIMPVGHTYTNDQDFILSNSYIILLVVEFKFLVKLKIKQL